MQQGQAFATRMKHFSVKLCDTHAHMDMEHFSHDRTSVLQRAREAGIELLVNVGIDLESSRKGVELSAETDYMFASVGVHPHNARHVNADTIVKLRMLAESPKVVAIGELGLDFYRNISPRSQQDKAFKLQLELSQELGLPVIVHCRNAYEEVLNVLEAYLDPNAKVIMHCFSGPKEIATECVKRNYYVSFAGNVTFPNAQELREAAKHVPVHLLLAETESPFLSPQPFRGKRNEPAYVRQVLNTLAEIKGLGLAELSEQILDNAVSAFCINASDFGKPL